MLKLTMLIALTAFFLGGGVSPMSSSHSAELSSSKLTHEVTYYYKRQTKRVVASCLPPKLLKVLGHIRKKTGVRPILTSGHRKGGRKKSMHRHCKAADIRVPGVSDKRLVQIARTAPGIGGIGRYCNGIIHVDVGARREWTHCKKKKR